MNLKKIKDLRLKTIKLLEENIDDKISDISLLAIFFQIYLLRHRKQKKKYTHGTISN